MSFFQKLTHQKSANSGDAPRRAFSVSITHAADVDEFAEALRGYHLGLMQIEKGPFSAQLVQTRLAGVLISAAQYGRAVVHSGQPPSGRLTFAVATSRRPVFWQGRPFGPDNLLLMTPGTEIDVVSAAGFGVVTASFASEVVKEAMDCFGSGPIGHPSTSLTVGLEHNKAHLLRVTFGALLNEAVARPLDVPTATWALSKQDDLLRALLHCISGSQPSTRSASSGERARVLKAAVAAINDRPEDVVTVGDLCRSANASERTLHHAFIEHFGLPPSQYMKARRLNAVRNELGQEDEPLKKISDVANKWGFWHLGQFAKDYRSWFGELPSETYERKHRTNPRRVE